MKKVSFLFNITLLTVFSFLLLINHLNAQDMNKLNLLPTPQSVEFIENEFFSISNQTKIYFIDKDIRKENTAKLISKSIKIKTNSEPKISYDQTKLSSDKSDSKIILKIVDKTELSSLIPKEKLKEAYELNITPKGIEIKAAESRGLFNGAISLIQIIDNCYNNKLTACKIIDYPDLDFRGVSDDISRGQVSTVENFKRILDFMARYKMNFYLPYLEDMLFFDKYPTIGVGRGALTREEVKTIVEYADNLFIEVIPVLQTLGHYENILSKPEFLQYAEFPGAASLCVSCEHIYPFLEDLLKEVFELFPSEYFHMGADESYDVGLGKSKHLLPESDIATLHANHYKRVYDICKKYNKKVMMYGDIILDLPKILDLIPKDIIIVDWHYSPAYYYPSTKKFNDYGFKYIASPSVWNFVTTFPTNINAFPNIYYMTKDAVENNSWGIINSNWGDYGAETIKELILFGYAFSAQTAWNFKQSDYDSFSYLFFNDFFGVKNKEGYEIYKLFSNPLNQFMWHEIWRHPLLPTRKPSWWENRANATVKMYNIDIGVAEVERHLESLQKHNNLINRDHLDVLNFYVELNKWFRNKLKLQEELQLIKSQDYEKSKYINLLNQNISDLEKLEAEYSKLWTNYYKKDNLNLIVAKFQRLLAYYKEIKATLENNGMPTNPIIQNQWISHPVEKTKIATFRTEFNLENVPSKAIIQLIGDTYAKLYVNGSFINEVYVRRSLSLYTEDARILMLDIANHLKKGKNEVVIEVENFNKNGSASVNLTSYFKDSNYRIDTYSEKKENNSEWFVKQSDGKEWLKPRIHEYPFEVIAPNFSSERKSWIER